MSSSRYLRWASRVLLVLLVAVCARHPLPPTQDGLGSVTSSPVAWRSLSPQPTTSTCVTYEYFDNPSDMLNSGQNADPLYALNANQVVVDLSDLLAVLDFVNDASPGGDEQSAANRITDGLRRCHHQADSQGLLPGDGE